MDARHVTMLFADVEGSTRQLSRDPDGFPERLERHRHIIATAVDDAGGELVPTEGDGCFAIIPDRAAAVRAVAEAQRLLREMGMPVRMGLHWGAVRRGAAGLVGIDTHRAARLADAAHGGQIVLSESTATDAPLPLVGRRPSGPAPPAMRSPPPMTDSGDRRVRTTRGRQGGDVHPDPR